MEPRSLQSALRRPVDSDPSRAGEVSPDSSFTTRLTPDSDSEDELELDDGELGEVGPESYKLQRRSRKRDVEKVGRDGGYSEEDDEDDHEPTRRRRRRASASTVQSYQLYTPDEERAVVRKFDRKLVLFVALLYMLSFLDRSSMLLFSVFFPFWYRLTVGRYWECQNRRPGSGPRPGFA